MTKSEYLDWKESPVTQEAWKAVQEAVEHVAMSMLAQVFSDPQADQYNKGFIRGVQAFLEWEPEFDDE